MTENNIVLSYNGNKATELISNIQISAIDFKQQMVAYICKIVFCINAINSCHNVGIVCKSATFVLKEQIYYIDKESNLYYGAGSNPVIEEKVQSIAAYNDKLLILKYVPSLKTPCGVSNLKISSPLLVILSSLLPFLSKT